DQPRQRCLTISRDGKVDFRQPAEVLIVRFDVEVARSYRSQFRTCFRELSRRTMELVSHGVYSRPEVGDFETDNNVRFSNGSCSALSLVERMQRRKVHAPALVDDCGLKRFRQFDK